MTKAVRYIFLLMAMVCLAGSVWFSADIIRNNDGFTWLAFFQLSFYLIVSTLALCMLVVLPSSTLRDNLRSGAIYDPIRSVMRQHVKAFHRLSYKELFWSTILCWPFVELELWATEAEVSMRVTMYVVLACCLILGYCDAYYNVGSRVTKEG